MKVVTIVGARPQFIKAAAVCRVLRESAQEVLVHTGQHYDAQLSDVFFSELDIPHPDYHLAVGSGLHAAQTGRAMTLVEDVLLREKPDSVIVYGDTNTTLAGALAAAKLGIPVAHVEAGLRSWNRRMPEEINRVLVDHISSFCFCPTGTSVSNLAGEGVRDGVHLVGDVMFDAVLHYLPRSRGKMDWFASLNLDPRAYVFATVHRAGNVDDPNLLREIVAGLTSCGSPVLFPLHPRTAKAISALRDVSVDNVRFIEPLGYLETLLVAQNARVIATDSGGLQKEALFLGVPCVTLRDETEWLETVESGWNVLAGASSVAIASAIRSARPGNGGQDAFGDGTAAHKIVDCLVAS